MAVRENEYHLVTFDPGGAATGWAHFILDVKAFTRPEHKVLQHLRQWSCGEFEGEEYDQLTEAVSLIHRARYGKMPFHSTTDVVSEDFDLTQLIGGNDLLSPVRINAVLDWECRNKFGLKLQLQRRHMRTNVTKTRLARMGFKERFSKDEFAAMQHAIVWLRRTKQQANLRPWKLGRGGVFNSEWDCKCNEGGKCDLAHA